jgi:hypothetical protein
VAPPTLWHATAQHQRLRSVVEEGSICVPHNNWMQLTRPARRGGVAVLAADPGVGPTREERVTPAFQRIRYEDLNARQQEAYNFQKGGAVLADYGYVTIRLSSDWEGADFIAQHKDGLTFLKVQLKGRLSFAKKYQGRGIHVCFREGEQWYLYPHDELLERVLAITGISTTESWTERGGYSFPTVPHQLRELLAAYRL